MREVVEVFESRAGGRPAHRVLGMTRRQLWTLAGLVGAGAVGLACTEAQIEELFEQIRNRPVRREINSLPPDHPVIASYASAIEAMQELPESDLRNWNRQAQIHDASCRHHNWLFLPWHRAYLFHFEQICRELSGDDGFALPYWNWTANRQIPAVFWDTSSPLYHANRVADQDSEAAEAAVDQNVVNNALAPTNFILFAGQAVGLNHPPNFGPGMGPLESGPHNYIHNFVGGTMASFVSPGDPVFWLHHARIDELWVRWNLLDEKPNTNHTDWTNTEFTEFCDRAGNPTSVQVSLTTVYPLLSYRYDTQGVV